MSCGDNRIPDSKVPLEMSGGPAALLTTRKTESLAQFFWLFQEQGSFYTFWFSFYHGAFVPDEFHLLLAWFPGLIIHPMLKRT